MATDYSKWRASPEQVERFRTKAFDFSGARDKMVARIERTIKQLNGDRVAPQGGKDFQTLEANGVVYRPTLNGHPIEAFDTGDEDGFHADRDALKEMLPHFIEDVKGGHFDSLLKTAMESKKPETGKATLTNSRAPRASSGASLGKVARPDDAEWMAQFEAKVGKPDASLKDPVPNSKGTKWIERAFRDRGTSAAASRAASNT